MSDGYRGMDWCNDRIEQLKRERDRLREALDSLVKAVGHLPVEDWVETDGRGDPELIGYLMQAREEWDDVKASVEYARTALQEAGDE